MVYAPRQGAGRAFMNTRTQDKERAGRLLEMHANDMNDQDAVYAGDIVAAVGLKNTRTGDTLSDPNDVIVYAGGRRIGRGATEHA